METQLKMYYIALLGNTDETITKIDIGQGFKIKKMAMHKFATMCEEGFFIADVWPKLDHDWGCVPPNSYYRPRNVYVIKKKLPDHPIYKGNPKDIDAQMTFWDEKHKYQQKISNYIEEKIKKLRLIKEGSIKVSVEIFYIEKNKEMEMSSMMESMLSCENRVFSLSESEIDEANKFLTDCKTVKPQKYIQLALDNFHLSYQAPHNEFEFLSLMISLEALLNDGKTELRMRIARGCAVLLGHTHESARKIFNLTRDLYDKRSALVHTGDRNKITPDDTLHMKEIVRQCLRKALELNIPKQDLSAALMESGFGNFTLPIKNQGK